MPLLFAMQYKKYILGILALLASILISWLSFLHVDWLLLYTLFSYIFGGLLLWMCVTPAGSVVLGRQDEATPLIVWFGQIIKGQVILLIFTLAAYVGFFLQGPQFANQGISLSFATNTIADYSRWMWALFPFGLYAFWGLVIAYIVYVKRGKPFFYQLALGFFSKRFDPMLKSYVIGAVNGSTMIALSLVACAIALILSYAIKILYGVSAIEIPAMTYLLLSFLMLYLSIKPGKRFFRRLTVKSRSYILFYTTMILLLAALLTLSGFVNVLVAKTHPELLVECAQCRAYLNRVSEEVRFAAVYWGWWAIWTPLAGSYLASISRGRTIREFVLGVFAFPLALCFIFFKWGTAPLTKGWLWVQQHYTDMFAGFPAAAHDTNEIKAMMLLTLGFATVAIFMLMLKRFHRTDLFSSGYMPQENGKENRLWLEDATKEKGISKITQKLALVLMGTVFIHTVSGWYGIQIEVIAMGILLLNAAYAGFHLLVLRFLFDSVWIGNRNVPPY